jgi:site-specific recombinase XerD
MLLRHYMNVLFWFRKNTRALDRPGTVYCRITVDSVEYNFATIVRVYKEDWNAKQQEVRGRNDSAKVSNQQLTQLADGLREAFNILERERVFITPERVMERYQEPQRRQIPLRELMSRYSEYLRAEGLAGNISAGTLDAYLIRLSRLDEWIADTKRSEMRPAEFKVKLAQQFFDWLRAKPRSKNYCIKVLDVTHAMFKWAARKEIVEANPMAGFSEKQEAAKPPVFLTPPELVKLWYYEFESESLRKVADLFLFQSFTGLAWQDMTNFRASEHLMPQPSGAVLLRVDRQKTGTPTLIPLFQPAFDILAKYGGERLPVPSKPYMNRALKQVAYLIGLKQHVTTHVGRKTAGMVLLQDGVPMTIVSKVLGHRSVRVTERHYASVLPHTIVNELAKIYGAQVLGATQAHKPFLTEFTERLLAA